MPFRPDPFLKRFEPLGRARRRAGIGYGVAVVTVALSTVLRLALSGPIEHAPFVTFYPALAVATFFGGWGSGLLALALATLAADFFFLPPPDRLALSPAIAGDLAAFLVVGLGLVCLVKLLNVAVDRLALQSEKASFLFDAAPAGMLAVDDEGLVQLANAAVERQFGYHQGDLLGKPDRSPRPQRAAQEPRRRARAIPPRSRGPA
jgi:PAS domain-containing protein